MSREAAADHSRGRKPQEECSPQAPQGRNNEVARECQHRRSPRMCLWRVEGAIVPDRAIASRDHRRARGRRALGH